MLDFYVHKHKGLLPESWFTGVTEKGRVRKDKQMKPIYLLEILEKKIQSCLEKRWNVCVNGRRIMHRLRFLWKQASRNQQGLSFCSSSPTSISISKWEHDSSTITSDLVRKQKLATQVKVCNVLNLSVKHPIPFV